MNKRIISFFLSLCMIFTVLSSVAFAAESYGYVIKTSGTSVSVGAEVEAVVALTDYDNTKSGIKGLQIDIGNIDPNIIEVISQKSLIGANSKATYQPKRRLIRLLYIDVMNGTELEPGVKDLIYFKIKIKDNITQSGSITLPITIKIGNAASERIVLKDNLVINYSPKNADIVKVDVAWGNMDFIYDEGVWNSECHKWENSGWRAATGAGNIINITNTGTADVKLDFSYTPNAEFEKLSGDFTDSLNSLIKEPINVKADAKVNTFKFNLQGSLDSRLSDEYVVLGKITVKII